MTKRVRKVHKDFVYKNDALDAITSIRTGMAPYDNTNGMCEATIIENPISGKEAYRVEYYVYVER